MSDSDLLAQLETLRRRVRELEAALAIATGSLEISRLRLHDDEAPSYTHNVRPSAPPHNVSPKEQ